jgi:hypothetical protein
MTDRLSEERPVINGWLKRRRQDVLKAQLQGGKDGFSRRRETRQGVPRKPEKAFAT